MTNLEDVGTTDFGKFSRSKRGVPLIQKNLHFMYDIDLRIKFKAWAKDTIKTFTIQKACDWINDNVVGDWNGKKLKEHNISYPATPYIVSGWIQQIGFEYKQYRKSYYVDRHEDADVVASRKNIYAITSIQNYKKNAGSICHYGNLRNLYKMITLS